MMNKQLRNNNHQVIIKNKQRRKSAPKEIIVNSKMQTDVSILYRGTVFSVTP